jgi:site-specific DNA-methyltransferase (adenine-specific)
MRQEYTVNKQKIINNDCLAELKTMADKSIDVVVTSPPYNINIQYNTYQDNLKFEDYWKWIYVIFKNIHRVMKDNGSFFLNVGSTCKYPCFAMDVCKIVENSEFTLQNNIIWVKSIAIKDNSYGHFKPVPGNRFLNNQFENIFHFTKDGNIGLDRLAVGVPYADKSNIDRWEHAKADVRCKGNVWFLPYKTVQKQKLHPAGFPVELPDNCIKLHGVKDNMVVLDPFLGAGTTLVACQKLGVNGIGIDLDGSYCNTTIRRLNEPT